MKINRFLAGWIAVMLFSFSQSKAQPAIHRQTDSLLPVPIGLDAYLMWDKWPLQRIGARAYMRSTYDRRGGNESADAGHFLFANGETENVSLDVKGEGVLYFFRANHWHGSPWHFTVDGRDNIVQETGTADPVHARELTGETSFIPEKAFPSPLNRTWGFTKGADLIWTPIPFERSMRIAYSRTRYGTGYYIYQLYADEKKLSRPVTSWRIDQPPSPAVLDLIGRSGADIAPKNIAAQRGEKLLDRKSITLSEISTRAASCIRAFKLSLPLDKAIDLERVRLMITWDHAEQPSVNAPLCLFFGAGTFYNRDEREYLVKGFPINVRYDHANRKVELACYYPMPFFESAKFELSGIEPGDERVSYEIRYEPLHMARAQSSYFHASYQDIPVPEPGRDLVYLDTYGIEGHKEWSGSFVGISFIFSHNGNLTTLEGDPRFFFDDSQTPQAYGTGTEEWGGGGDYWGGQNMTLPFAGHPCGAAKKSEARQDKDLIESAYRFLLADLMPFGRRAVIRFEHGGENLSPEHYEGVTYWYGLPVPSLVRTDALDIGNPESEKSHRYLSPQASAVDTLFSRYEWGIDSFPAKAWGHHADPLPGYSDMAGTEVYPAHEEDGRYTRGVSEFEIRLDPDNRGVLLRRTLDYRFPNQTAEVFISDIGKRKNGRAAKWQSAGLWYLAGSNTCVYSDPKGELDQRKLVVQTSDRRFRDDEFLLPARLTEKRTAVRVRLKFIPDEQELFPGHPFPESSAWSELRYEVYCYKIPAVHRGPAGSKAAVK
jgi:hypothetical protein